MPLYLSRRTALGGVAAAVAVPARAEATAQAACASRISYLLDCSYDGLAELQIIGTLMASPDTYRRLSSIVHADHFHDPVHGLTFTVAGALIDAEQQADWQAVASRLGHALDALGGPGYLRDIRAWSLRDDGAKLAEAARNVAKTFHQRIRLRIALALIRT